MTKYLTVNKHRFKVLEVRHPYALLQGANGSKTCHNINGLELEEVVEIEINLKL